jgi:hypothetical protein
VNANCAINGLPTTVGYLPAAIAELPTAVKPAMCSLTGFSGKTPEKLTAENDVVVHGPKGPGNAK